MILIISKILSRCNNFSLIFGLIFLFYGCNPTKTLKENEEFLQSNKVNIDNSKINKDEVINIIKQKPNKKILGLFRFHLGVYNFFSNKKASKIRENVGEAPVIYDSLLTERSVKQIELYLDNKGFFQNQVSTEKKVHKNKVKQIYNIKAGEPYLINEIGLIFHDQEIGAHFLGNKDYSLIVKGKNFDVDVLDKERERIKNVMKNHGFYYYSNNFIKYKVDTTIGNQKVNITIELLEDKKQLQGKDSSIDVHHTKYAVNDIYMFVGSKSSIEKATQLDTIPYKYVSIIYTNKLKFKPKMLARALDFKPKETYSQQEQNTTYKQFSGLKLFKNISIIYEKVDSNQLNANIYLAPLILKSFALEGIGTNTGGDLGVEGSIGYENKNIFRGGELFNIRLKGGLQIQRVVDVSNDENEIFGTPFNTLELGPEVSLEFPRFLFPFNLDRVSRHATPKTIVTSTFNFQQRPEYARNLIQGTFGYSWNESQYKKHFITPFNVSFIKLDLTTAFKDKITAENNPFLINAYTDHFISAIQYSFIFNNQDFNRTKNYQYFKFNIETSGNMLSSYYRLTDKPKDIETNSYNFIGIRYAEYVRTEIDLRLYHHPHGAVLVERLNVGVGVPYGNLNVLPFEKSYFGGGSNGIRAWPARGLGPGSLSDTLLSSVNQIGELKIEANIEYRFDITKLFKGAFFVDAGNIWILKEDAQRPNAEINYQRFYEDLAIGVGFGLRLDFNFFIFRFDIATPLKDPSKNNPRKYQLELKKTTLNLGIGYPF